MRVNLSDIESACSAVPAWVHGDQHALPVELPAVVRLDVESFPSSENLGPCRCHRGNPGPVAGLWSTDLGVLDSGVSPVDPPELAAPPVREKRPHEVHVCRHRLLLQPCGCESFLWVPKSLYADDLPVPEG